MNFHTVHIASALIVICAALSVQAQTSIADAISKGRPVTDARGRFETVQDTSKFLDANASTLRARLG
ncbi:MAG TPA: hypothetical protein VJL82_03415 [Rhizomicrobium sp.]|nr:hypothetical protein [Rhizomicrobium sp.]